MLFRSAINQLDAGGGSDIGVGSIYVDEAPNTTGSLSSTNQLADNLGLAGFTPYVKAEGGETIVTGTTPNFGVSTGTFSMYVTEPGSASYTAYTITQSTATAAGFVSGILAAGDANINAVVNSNGTITLTHLTGGTILLQKISGQPNLPYLAGFTAGTTGVRSIGGTDSTNVARLLTAFNPLTYLYGITQPAADPANGTLWYYSDPTVVDIMINTGTAWQGYQTVSLDARGYNLTSTNATGVIVAAVAPTTQSNGYSPLVAGDLWLNTSDLEHWPNLSRYNGTNWVSINNTDQISVNGIVFADARWDGAVTNGVSDGGTTDPATGTEDTVASLLTSNYVDMDAPNPLLYPRGMLLFNTRQIGRAHV